MPPMRRLSATSLDRIGGSATDVNAQGRKEAARKVDRVEKHGSTIPRIFSKGRTKDKIRYVQRDCSVGVPLDIQR